MNNPIMKNWYKVGCYSCETDFYWSRAEPKDINLLTINGGTITPLCAECKDYETAFEEGYRTAISSIEESLINRVFISNGAKIKIKSLSIKK